VKKVGRKKVAGSEGEGTGSVLVRLRRQSRDDGRSIHSGPRVAPTISSSHKLFVHIVRNVINTTHTIGGMFKNGRVLRQMYIGTAMATWKKRNTGGNSHKRGFPVES